MYTTKLSRCWLRASVKPADSKNSRGRGQCPLARGHCVTRFRVGNQGVAYILASICPIITKATNVHDGTSKYFYISMNVIDFIF